MVTLVAEGYQVWATMRRERRLETSSEGGGELGNAVGDGGGRKNGGGGKHGGGRKDGGGDAGGGDGGGGRVGIWRVMVAEGKNVVAPMAYMLAAPAGARRGGTDRELGSGGPGGGNDDDDSEILGEGEGGGFGRGARSSAWGVPR